MTLPGWFLFYTRDGVPCEMGDVAAVIRECGGNRVAQTVLASGKVVSTVYLGINHALPGHPPHIFETMVFPSENYCQSELACRRYSTEEEARAGHEAVVAEWKDK